MSTTPANSWRSGWARRGFEEDILERVMELLDSFDDDREALFEEMLQRLEAPGHDGLTDRWETACERRWPCWTGSKRT